MTKNKQSLRYPLIKFSNSISLLKLLSVLFHVANASIINQNKFEFLTDNAKSSISGNVFSDQQRNLDDFFPVINEFSNYADILPQIYNREQKRVMRSTLDSKNNLHASLIIITYYLNGEKIELDLRRNDDLLPQNHFLSYQKLEGSGEEVMKNFTNTEVELCHYQGSIRGKPNSKVAVSTCDGVVNGVVFDGPETYFIHSVRDQHLLLRHADMKNIVDKNENIIKDENSSRGKRSYAEHTQIHGPYNENNHSSYVELVLVVDNGLYRSLGGNLRRVHNYCKDLTNIVNALYTPLNIFVALTGVVVWSVRDEIEFSTSASRTLHKFYDYRRRVLSQQYPNDHAQLLRKDPFGDGIVGKAFVGPICSHESSGAIIVSHSPIIGMVANTMTHEMGHSFGMEHDTPDCKCPEIKCIMSATSTSFIPTYWSSCSIQELNYAFSHGMNYCLRNKPTRLFESPVCGNGFVESGEQCDCGLPGFCESKCCDPHTCTFLPNAQCATGKCCNLDTCLPKTAGTKCRGTTSECDLPEYCTGESEYCPKDVFKRDAEECDNGQAFCYHGDCRSHKSQCRVLWGTTATNLEACNFQNVKGTRFGNCGYDRIMKSYKPCRTEDVACGMIFCHHLNDHLEFGSRSTAETASSFISLNRTGIACHSALIDFGLENLDPGMVPNGAKCGDGKMCVDQKCLSVDAVRAYSRSKSCPSDCSGNGVCNSDGNCYCNIGFGGESCSSIGPGGSVDSGPATNEDVNNILKRYLYIFFLGVLPFLLIVLFAIWCCRYRRRHQTPKFGKSGELFVPDIVPSKTASTDSLTPAPDSHICGYFDNPTQSSPVSARIAELNKSLGLGSPIFATKTPKYSAVNSPKTVKNQSLHLSIDNLDDIQSSPKIEKLKLLNPVAKSDTDLCVNQKCARVITNVKLVATTNPYVAELTNCKRIQEREQLEKSVE